MLSSQRSAYGDELVKICREDPRVMALDADLCGSTQSQQVEKNLPERFFEIGIGEQNMAGVALSGKIPVIHSFAVFVAGRAFEQIRQSICLPNLPVIVVGASCGLSDYGDGATHQCFEDVAIMRTLPHMTVFSPADALEARKAIRAAHALPGPSYIRVNRNDIPEVTSADTPLVIGKPALMADGRDVAICASGRVLAMALEAKQLLADKGVDAKVLNFATIKPLDPAAVRAAIGSVSRIVTVEEHSIIGGLGAAILEALADNPLPLRRVGIQDTFGQSSESYDKL